MRRWSVLLVVFATLALAATSCSDRAGETGASSEQGASRPATNATSAPLLPTQVAALPDMDPEGFRRLLEELRGTPVVVNFWGSWCGPCREEAPDLAAAAERHGDRIQFLGVDILDERGAASRFIDEFGWTFPSVFDADGSIRTDLGFTGQPITLFYDETGELVHRWQGPLPPEELQTGLDLLL